MTAAPVLESSVKGDRLELVARGAWTARHADALEALVDQQASATARAPAVSINMSGVNAFDTFGAWLLERLMRGFRKAGSQADIVGLHDDYAVLLREMSDVNTSDYAPPVSRWTLATPFDRLGRNAEDLVIGIVPFVNMLGAVGTAIGRVAMRPASFRFTSMVHQFDRVCWQAIPIVLLITFLIGCIIAQQGFFHFRQFGADTYVVDMVGILVIREIGVLIVAIMVAGRSGSSYTAELGSMKMREEIDALRTMGFDPVEVLILPRLIALIVAVPVLTFLGSMSALLGGAIVAVTYGGMSPEIFIERLRDAISITSFKVGLIKAPFMALAIGLVACTEGFRVKGSAESLGIKTTDSVVKAIFMVIVMDGLFAIFFASIGM
jgi:phospholipid/cholesterol/gamma-HCH transport system permease protein